MTLITDPASIFVATTAELADQVGPQLPELPPENIIVEPARRNSAGACALATAAVSARCGPDSTIALVPADAWVADTEKYGSTLLKAASVAEERRGIVVIGMQPQRPDTNYGYIRPGAVVSDDCWKVAAFVEKPARATAVALVEEGCLWNAGIFVWRADVARRAFEQFLPQHARLFITDVGTPRAAEQFKDLPGISIDYGVAEKSDNVYCVAGRFAWDDLGTWDGMGRVIPANDRGNVSIGASRFDDASGCITLADTGEIVALGVSDLVIVRYGDTVLVCPRSKAHEVGKMAQRSGPKETQPAGAVKHGVGDAIRTPDL